MPNGTQNKFRMNAKILISLSFWLIVIYTPAQLHESSEGNASPVQSY